MLRLTPILLVLAYGVAMWFFSAWRLRRELDARSVPLEDPRLAPLIARLALALGVPRIPVRVYEIEPVNGLAAPDGRIFLTRGFLRRFEQGLVTAEEMASVIAHELGHVALGHTRRRMIDFTGQNVLRVVLASVLGRILPGLGVWIANTVSALLMARLSRQDEFEADAWAAALLVKAGIGTAPQKRLLEKLGRLAGSGNEATPAWLLTHPKPAERIRAIERLERRWRLVRR